MQASNSERSRFKSSDANQHQNVLEENDDLQPQKMYKQANFNKRDPTKNVTKPKADIEGISTFNEA